MVKLFKNKVDITGVAVLLMAFFVAVGFTAAEEIQQDQWYEVTITGSNPENPSNQNIGIELDEEPSGNCNTTKDSVICAIQLRLESGVLPPSTVEQAIEMEEDEDLEILGDAHSLFKSSN